MIPNRPNPTPQTQAAASLSPHIQHDETIVMRITAVDKRVDDLRNELGNFGTNLSIFSIVITVLVIFFSLKTEGSAVSRAESAAKLAIKTQIEEVEQSASQAKAHAQSASATLDEIRSFRGVAEKMVDEMQTFGLKR